LRPFTTIASLIFAVICVVHAIRLCCGWEIILNGIHIPMWISGIAMIATGGLSFMLWRESQMENE